MRAERDFGFRARTTFRAGLRATIDWYESTRAPAPRAASVTTSSEPVGLHTTDDDERIARSAAR
jgi:hypothetical protein